MATDQNAQDVDVRSIWSGVRRALPLLLILTLIVGAATFVVLSMMAPRYEAEAQLTITAKRNDPFNSQTDVRAAASVTPRLDPAAINTHVRALMAPDLLLKVGRELKLGERAEFNAAVGPVDTLDSIRRLVGIGGPKAGQSVDGRILVGIRRNLTVSSARQSRFIAIRFRATDPKLAADVANAIARTYRQSLRDIPVRETNEAVAVLEPKIQQLQREVFEADAIAKRFRAESDQLTAGTIPQTLQQQRINTLNTELVRAEAQKSNAEARLSAARELAINGRAGTLPEVQQSRVIQDLIAQRVRVERQVNEARAVLLPAHPRMRQLNADLAGVRRSIRSEVLTIVDSISKEVNLAQLRSRQLRDQIAALKINVAAKSGDAARLRELETTATSKRNELERLQKQLEDNRTVVDTNRVPVEANIVSLARPNNEVVFPKKTSFTVLSMAAVLMLGISLVIAKELMASGPAMANRSTTGSRQKLPRSARGSQHARRANSTTEAAAIANAAARMPQLGGQASEIPHGASDLTTLASRYLAAAPASGGHRLLISGGHSGLDPSNEAIELAGELSDAGQRVLIIDWAPGGQSLFTDVTKGAASSLADLIDGAANFDDVLVSLPDSNVHYAYASATTATDQFESEANINLILDALDEAYDHIIVVARREDARVLFETIEGRFDAGLTIVARSGESDPSGTFLDFDVSDIDIAHVMRDNGKTPARKAPSRLGNPA